MAVVSGDYLTAVQTSFRAMFRQSFEAANALQGWQSLANRVPSTTERNTYEWFGTVPKMQNVSHDVVAVHDLAEYNFSIENEEFQTAIEVRRTAMERDQLGLISPRIRQIGGEASRHPGELIFELAKDNPVCFTGKTFFANDHVIGESGTIDNILAGTGVTPISIRADLALGRTAMRKFKDDRGRVMNITGSVLMVPPELEYAAYAALQPNLIQATSSTISNPVIPPSPTGVLSVGGYSIVVNPFMTDADDWYLLHVGSAEDKPFIWQVEKMPVLESDTDPQSREAIQQRTFLYSVYGRYAVGVTDPRFALKFVN